MTTNITETPPAALAGHTSTAAQRASDERMARETDRLTQSIDAINREKNKARRPALVGYPLAGRPAELWGPIAEREITAYQRLVGGLEKAPEAGENVDAIIAELLDAGRRRVAQPADAAERLAAIEHRDALAEASRAAILRAGAVVAHGLTKLAKENKRDILAAAAADIADLAKQAEAVATKLGDVTDADGAIGKGVVGAWKDRARIREDMAALAGSLHVARQITTSGYEFVGFGRVPTLRRDSAVLPSSTWAVVDDILDRLEVTDAARALMTGVEK